MERHTAEQKPDVRVEEIPTSETRLLREAATLVSTHSWGEDYPVSPYAEIEEAEYRIGAKSQGKLIGFATVSRTASPDGIDNGELWLAHAVVAPEFRKQGVFEKLYGAQLEYAQKKSGRILSCTDNPIVAAFFLARGWKEVRVTQDESGAPCSVYELTQAN